MVTMGQKYVMSSFFRELKQRKIYRVAAGAWLVVQISATVIPAYHTAEWILSLLITVVAFGFPMALVLAWAFEGQHLSHKNADVPRLSSVSRHSSLLVLFFTYFFHPLDYFSV
jgi:magnesium-transporting ATPase (P-type)